MSFITDSADVVADWTSLGVKLPKPLTDALAVYDETRYVQYEAPVIDVHALTAKNVGAEIERVAGELSRASLTEARPEGGGTRAWDHARSMVREALARQVLHTAGASVPEIIEVLTPRFDAAVDGLKAALERLPEDLTPEELVKAGPDALVALGEARDHVKPIRQADSWLGTLTKLPMYVGTAEPVLRVFAPETVDQLQLLTTAHSSTTNELTRELGGLYVAGIRAGVPTTLNTPHDTARIRQQIEDRVKALRAASRI